MSRAAVEHARDAVAAQRRRCREVYDEAKAWGPGHAIIPCWKFHTEVRKLEQLQADLAYLERSP